MARRAPRPPRHLPLSRPPVLATWATTAAIALVAVAAACGTDTPLDSFSWEAFAQPPVEARPWVRWWWPGNDVQPAELAREVTLAAANGFGGLELQAFDAALDPDDPDAKKAVRRSVDSDAWYANVRAALDAARSSGLRMDLTLGSGWPTGGPFVDVDDSMRTLLSSEHPVKGPGATTVTFTVPDADPFYAVTDIAASIGEPLGTFLPTRARLVAVVAARVVQDDRDPEVFVLTDTVTLDPATVQVLTDRVSPERKAADGTFQPRTLAWDVPEGDWRVIGFWALPDGEAVSLHAYPPKSDASPESYVLDPFDATRVQAAFEHLLGERTGLAGSFGGPLRGVFVDSFELECERHWADDFLDQFRQRRGYDLQPWLPVVLPPGADNQLFDGAGIAVEPSFALGADDERVRWDYQLTVSDLFIERFLATAADRSESRGLAFRAQPYGIRIDALKAAGACSIPETESLYAGGSDLFLKSVSSGAHLYGRRLVGQESLVWAGRDWMTTPRKAKAALDKSFVAGVNAVVYHGYPYRTGDPAFGPTDWLPFCSTFGGMGTYSTGIGEADPFWPWMPDLNRYVGRVQGALRLGEPESDLLVYYPWLAIPASLMRLDDSDEPLYHGTFEDEADTGNNSLLGLIDGLFGGKALQPATLWLGALRPVLSVLEDRGFAWDWVNDDRLAAAVAAGEGVAIDGRRFRGVVVPDAAWMSPEAAESLARLASAGVPVVFAGATPSRQPGFAGKDAGDARVQAAVTTALSGARTRKGDLVTDIPSRLDATGLGPWLKHHSSTSTSPVRHLRRLLPGGARVVFLRNPGIDPVSMSFVTQDDCTRALVADPWAGTVGVPARPEGFAHVDLPAYGSRLLLCDLPTPSEQGVDLPEPMKVPAAATARVLPVADWTLKVEGSDVAGGTYQADADALGDWRLKTELAGSASTGLYTASVDLVDPGPSDRVLLDLGWLHGAASVRFNGKAAGDVVIPPYVLDVTSIAAAGSNSIQVTLTPPLRNRMLALGDAGDATAKQYKGKSETRIAAGLVGPVVVTIGPP